MCPAFAGTGRSHLAHRLAIVAADAAEARAALLASKPARPIPKSATARSRQAGAPRSFSSTLAPALNIQEWAAPSTRRRRYFATPSIFATSFEAGRNAETVESVFWESTKGDPPIHEIGWTQPAMFAIEYALTTLWRSWGIAPAAVIGHSAGEYAAACAAGVFSLEDGLRLIAERGRLMQSLPPGGMMAALFSPIDEIRPRSLPCMTASPSQPSTRPEAR